MTYSLEGLKAIVCGSTQGIGRACAIEMARHGAEVTLMARDSSGLERVQSELPATHGQAHHYLVADFTDPEAVRTRARDHVAASGPTHILLNNTGGPPAGPVSEAEVDDLLAAFKNVLEYASEEPFEEVFADQVTIDQKMDEIEARLRQESTLTLDELLAPTMRRIEIICVFLALLDLVRLRRVFARQSRLFDTVHLYWAS